jgi:hypothetical protein
MPVNYYANKTLEELQAILDRLQGRQTAGTITEFSAAGVRTVRTVENGSSPVQVEILRVLYSMYVIAQGTDQADKFPNPYKSRITRVRPDYSGSSNWDS